MEVPEGEAICVIYTTLMLAVNDESENIVRLLFQQGTDVVCQDNCGWTAEEYAFVVVLICKCLS